MRLSVVVGALLGLMFHVPAYADPAPDYAGTTLTGDWGGARSAAWDKGWTWEAGLKVDSQRNRGGIGSGSRTMSQIDLKLRADLEKVMGWEGGVAYVNVIDDRGSGVNALHTGSIMGVTNIEVPVPTAKLFHAWLQQSFDDDRLSLLAGLYPIDAEFFTMDSAALLIHPAYGPPADLSLTRGPSIFNNSAFGVRAKVLSEDRTLYGMAALMDGIPNDPARPKATTIRFAKGDGAFVIAELGWTPDEECHAFESIAPARVLKEPTEVVHRKYEGLSKYAVGVWRYGNRVDDQIDVDANGDPARRRSQGAYVLAERTLWSLGGDAARDLTAFVRVSRSSGDDTSLDRMWNLGVRVRGPLASRPDDALLIAFTRGGLSPKFRAAQEAGGTATASAEDALEIAWRFALRPWLWLQPDIQYVRHPGGDAATPAATLVGGRLEIAF